MKKLTVFLLCLGFSSVLAHPSFENKIVTAGVTFKADMMVTHGCGSSPTISVIIDVPEEVLAVTPRVKPGWNIETVESKLAAPRVLHGIEITKYTSQIIWSGGNLSSDYFDLFSFIVIPPIKETKLYFPIRQICVEGEDAYTGIPDSSNKNEQLEDAAPLLTVVKREDDGGYSGT